MKGKKLEKKIVYLSYLRVSVSKIELHNLLVDVLLPTNRLSLLVPLNEENCE